jgi:pimeloyl-ACP methyl ester carboxylesterase
VPLPNPVIFVPGVTATDLRDVYTFPPDTIWSLLTHHYERAGLHPEDQRYESQQPAQIRPDQVFEVAYKEMVLDLRHDLSPTADRTVPVYLFGYDWRQPLEATQALLAAFIAEVIEKTALTRHYRADGYDKRRRVNLVAHSMGGLIVTGYLDEAGAKAPVDRVATIATPFKGSLDAVEKIVRGTTNRREREAARLTPSLYYLLPSFQRGIAIDASLPQSDMFDPKLWQRSVVESIQEALRLRGSGAVGPTQANAAKVLDALLKQAKAHRAKVDAFDPAVCGLEPTDWLCVIGIGDKTRVALNIANSPIGPAFDLLSPSMIDDVISSPPSWRTGDGIVPYEGAQPSFNVTRQIVSRRDFRFLELREKLLDSLAALHGIVPNMDKIQSMLVNHLAR